MILKILLKCNLFFFFLGISLHTLHARTECCHIRGAVPLLMAGALHAAAAGLSYHAASQTSETYEHYLLLASSCGNGLATAGYGLNVFLSTMSGNCANFCLNASAKTSWVLANGLTGIAMGVDYYLLHQPLPHLLIASATCSGAALIPALAALCCGVAQVNPTRQQLGLLQDAA